MTRGGMDQTSQYQRVYLPVNQVQAIMRLRVGNWQKVARGKVVARGKELPFTVVGETVKKVEAGYAASPTA